jgi:DNA-binding SARP family transcriptional activator/tetratricopeptide (TPR) repeat protein
MLGPLEAWHDGRSVPLGDQQQRFVLVVLLLHANKPVSAERLTEIVWGGNPERRNLVRGYINKLRNTVRDANDVGIDTTPTGYVLRIDERQLDTARFDRLRAEAARAGEPRAAIELLRAAVGLWRGRFLEDIDIDRVGGSEVFLPDAGYLDTVGDLAELELETGDHRSARDRLRPVVRADFERQRHAELLMRALLAGGDRVAAIRIFHATRDALAGINVEPGPVLRNLAARAEHGEPASFLPSRPGAFTGRAEELDAIEAAAGERRTVWVSGAPSVGKTGLAVEAAHRLRDRFPDGRLLVRLNGFTPNVAPTTVADALTQLLTELGVPPEQIPATEGRKVALYQSELYGTRTLVVLDNAVSPDQIRPLLPEAPGCMAIVTSRRMGEPDTGTHLRLAPLPAEDAASLFRALTDPARVRGRSAEVAEVAERCDHLPAPIIVAAALFRRHDRWPLDHLLKLLDADYTPVRVSYEQLDAPQRHMFRLLGHLPGPDLDVAGAAALAGLDVAAARAALDDLHEVCLLEEVGTERYQMLDPVKEFAAAELSPATPTEHPDALLRLLDFYLVALAEAVGTGYPFDRAQPPEVDRSCPVAPTFESADDALAWIAAERDNLVAAIRYAATHDLPEHTWRLAVLMWRHFNTTSQFEDWIETMELAWEIVSTDSGNDSDNDYGNDYGQAHVLLRLATAHNRRGRLTEALELAARALPKWTRLGDVRGEAATLCAIAIPTMELGKHDQAIAHFAAALDRYEECGDRRGQAHALSMLGYLNGLHGNLEVALSQQLAAVRTLREIGHLQGLAHALNILGTAQERLGHLPDALASHTEALELASGVGDQCAVAYALNNLGNVHRSRGRLAEAVRHQERAMAVAADVSDADLRTQLYRDRGATAQARGDQAEAFRAYQSALDLANGTGNRTHQAHANRGIARTLHAMDRHAEAAAHWHAAETGFTVLALPEAPEIHAERAALTCACRRPPTGTH